MQRAGPAQKNKKQQRPTTKKAVVKHQKKTISTTKRRRATTTTTIPQSQNMMTSLSAPIGNGMIRRSTRTIVTELGAPEQAAKFIEGNSTGKKLVVVDFYADWCGPCRALAPQFAKMSETYKNVQFAKINVDEYNASEIQPHFPDVSALPTAMFFVDNRAVDTVVGMAPEKIVATIQKYADTV